MRWIICAVLVASWALAAQAAVPGYLTYSGRLTDGTGWGTTTTANLRVLLLTCGCAHEGGCEEAVQCAVGQTGLWFEGLHEATPVSDGYFSLAIGSRDTDGNAFPDPGATALPAGALPERLWLTVSVNGGKALEPRQAIGSVPYAATAGRAAVGSIDAAALADDAVGTQHLAVGAVDAAALGPAVVAPGHVAPGFGLVPAGAVLPFAGPEEKIPEGWLLCDGDPYPITAYPDLYAAIGTAHGVGADPETFRVPNYNGMFLRGVNHGRADAYRDKGLSDRVALDPGNAETNRVGSVQQEAFANHSHTKGSLFISSSGSHSHTVYGQVGDWARTDGNMGIRELASESHTYGNQTSHPASHKHDNADFGGSVGPSNDGGIETRPANAYVNWIIKY